MTIAFVDTVILIDILRNHPPAVLWLFSQPGMSITPVVYMELLAGNQNKQERRAVDKLVAQFEMVYYTTEDMKWALKKMHSLRLSHGVGQSDCLIAAPSARLQLSLYTLNLKHMTPLIGALAVKPY
jgi:predicted nucleic acid-binding protein